MLTPAFYELPAKEWASPRFDVPDELLVSHRSAMAEGKTYDAGAEDVAFLEKLKHKPGGDVVGLDDLEHFIEELERERFCGRDKAGECQPGWGSIR